MATWIRTTVICASVFFCLSVTLVAQDEPASDSKPTPPAADDKKPTPPPADDAKPTPPPADDKKPTPPPASDTKPTPPAPGTNSKTNPPATETNSSDPTTAAPKPEPRNEYEPGVKTAGQWQKNSLTTPPGWKPKKVKDVSKLPWLNVVSSHKISWPVDKPYSLQNRSSQQRIIYNYIYISFSNIY